MTDIDLVKLKADIALRKSMPDFGPETSIKRLRIINNTMGSFTPEVVEALIEQLEAAQRERDEYAEGERRTAVKNTALTDENYGLRAELKRREEAASVPAKKPVLGYADSYRGMAARGVVNIPIWSVITDLERNIAPLCAAAPAAAPEKVVTLPAKVNGESVEHGGSGAFTMGKRCGINEGIVRCAAALDAAGVKWVEGE